MLTLGLILSIFAVGFLCWLIFTLAVYALPFFVAVTAGLAAYHHEAGLLGAILVALVTAASALAVGQIAFALVPSVLLRTIVALVFAIPAALAGYEATTSIVHLGMASVAWCDTFGVIGALLTGGTAFARMTILAVPEARLDPRAVRAFARDRWRESASS